VDDRGWHGQRQLGSESLLSCPLPAPQLVLWCAAAHLLPLLNARLCLLRRLCLPCLLCLL
jgi:hypothetical protein